MTEVVSKWWYGTFDTYRAHPCHDHGEHYTRRMWDGNAAVFAIKYGCTAAGTAWICRFFRIPPQATAIASICLAIEMKVDGCLAVARYERYTQTARHLGSNARGAEPLAVFARLGLRSILSGFCLSSGGLAMNHAFRSWKSVHRLSALGYGAFAVWSCYYGVDAAYRGCRYKLLNEPEIGWCVS